MLLECTNGFKHKKKKNCQSVTLSVGLSVSVLPFDAKLISGQFFRFFSSACGQRASAVPEVLGEKPNEACLLSFCKYEPSWVSGV